MLKRTGAKTLYIFDEPTTGLHFDDINKLLSAFRALIDAGGYVVGIGTPEEIMKIPESYTGRFLHDYLAKSNGHIK